MKNNLKQLISDYYEDTLKLYDEIYNLIVSRVFELQKENKECKYCKKVLTWLVFWENDFENFGLDISKVNYETLTKEVIKLCEYLKNHDIFGCNDECKIWNNKKLAKDVYQDLPDLVKSMSERYQVVRG